MDLDKIEFPEYLNRHTLTDQELAALATPGQQALAKDWNVLNRKMDWLITKVVFIHNQLADHDRQLEIWKRVYWLICLCGASLTGIIAILKMLGYFK